MKVALFIDTLTLGGAETMVARLGKQLNSSGINVVMCHFGNKYLEDYCRANNIPEIIVPHRNLYRSIITVYLFSLLFGRFLRKNHVTVLHSHLYGPITASFLGAYLFSIKHVGTLHDVYMVSGNKGRKLLLGISQRFKTQLITVSRDMESFYLQFLPLTSKIRTIHNGVEIQTKKYRANSRAANQKTQDPIRIITVGRLVKIKRQVEQLESLSKLLKCNPVEQIFVGDGPELQRLKETVERLGLEEKVQILGQRDDVNLLLASSDIFVLASSTEGLSCSIIEAMHHGLPCVVSDVGGNRELIEHNQNGYLFSTYESEDLRKNVQKLINNATLRKEMGERSVNLVDENFSIANMSDNYIECYSDS